MSVAYLAFTFIPIMGLLQPCYYIEIGALPNLHNIYLAKLPKKSNIADLSAL